MYPGIDVVYYSAGPNQIEYDLVVAAGADPAHINIAFEGARKVETNANGEVIADGLVQRAPRVYQDVAGQRIAVAARYRVKGNAVHIELGLHDRRRPLVIDPVLVWAARVGAPYDDGGYTFMTAFTTDTLGNVYLTGTTNSTHLALANAFQTVPNSPTTAFVMKLDSTGQNILYATYLSGSRSAQTTAIAVDSDGNCYVAGDTAATDFPLVNPVETDSSPVIYGYVGFLSKLAPDGSSLMLSTYVRDVFVNTLNRGAIAIDGSNNAFVKGGASLQKFAADGSRSWMNAVSVGVLAVDPDGNPVSATTACDGKAVGTAGAYQTSSAGRCDVLIQKWSGDGSGLLAATLFGGEGNEAVSQVRVSSSGAIYVAGTTTSTGLPVVAGAAQPALKGWLNGFLAVFDGSLGTLTGSTYFGGSGADALGGLSIAPNGDAYVSGHTISSDFPELNALGIAGSFTGVIPRSDDGGATWTSFASPPPLWSVFSLTVSDSIWLAFGNDDQGTALWRSADRGVSWSRVNGISFTSFARIAQSRVEPNQAFSYDAVLGYFYSSVDGGLTWSSLDASRGAPLFQRGYLLPHPTNATAAFGLGSTVTYTSDAGKTWRDLLVPFGHGFYGLTVDPANPADGFVACGDQGILRSVNQGASWKRVSELPCDALAGTGTTPQTLIAHTRFPASLIRSIDGGVSWTTLPLNVPVTQLAATPDGSFFYLSSGANLYRSSDGGTSWSSMPIPPSFLFNEARLVLDPTQSGALYGLFAGQSANFLALISADTKTINFSTLLGPGYLGPLPASAVTVSTDASGNAILMPPGSAVPPTSGSVNQGYISVVKIAPGK